MLECELLPPRAVPESLLEEVEVRAPGRVVDDRVRALDDRVARADRAEVHVDVLRGHEPFVEPADRLQDRPAVREVRRRVRHVGSLDDELDALEVLERAVADLDRPARDDCDGGETFAQLAKPERVRDRIAVDERDRLAARLRDPEVPAGPARAAPDEEMDEIELRLVHPDDVAARLLPPPLHHHPLPPAPPGPP